MYDHTDSADSQRPAPETVVATGHRPVAFGRVFMILAGIALAVLATGGAYKATNRGHSSTRPLGSFQRARSAVSYAWQCPLHNPASAKVVAGGNGRPKTD
jgi:hypothetical protein